MNGGRSPRELGFSMPPEWAPHAATWLAWPYDDELWVGHLEAVRCEFVDFIATIARHERVELLVTDEPTEADARRRLSGISTNLRFHEVPYSDIWLRDSGPIFVSGGGGELMLIDWEFNGWGKKYTFTPDNEIPKRIACILETSAVSTGVVMEGGSLEGNGAGVFLTTKQCLLSPERNASLDAHDIEDLLGNVLGAKKVIWLPAGLEDDHTDGHIDTISRFVSPGVIVTAYCEDRSDPNYDTLETNFDILASATDDSGRPFTIARLPQPRERLELDGARLASTYANFYICNDAVLVPQYDDYNDQIAVELLKPLFPDRQVIGLPARNLITGGGSFHCVSQQQPRGKFRRSP